MKNKEEIYAELDHLIFDTYGHIFRDPAYTAEGSEFAIEEAKVLEYFAEVIDADIKDYTIIIRHKACNFAIRYLYKGKEFAPVKPLSVKSGCVYPLIFRALKECISQDTNTPNIVHLYRPEDLPAAAKYSARASAFIRPNKDTDTSFLLKGNLPKNT